MESNIITLMGERCSQYKDREVYRVTHIGEFVYKSGKSDWVSDKVKFKSVQGNLEQCYNQIVDYKETQYGSFIIVDENLNRIGGDHCIRIKDRKNKYTIDLKKIEDTELCNEYDLLDYGICQVDVDNGARFEDVYGVQGLRNRSFEGLVINKVSSNMESAWIADGNLMVRIEDRKLPMYKNYDFRLTQVYAFEHLNSLWYRIKCVNEISGIPNRMIGSEECYVVPFAKDEEVLINKRFMERAIKDIQYIAIYYVWEDRNVYCYGVMEERVCVLQYTLFGELLESGKAVVPMENADIMGRRNSNLEYVPLPNGKFINIEGNIITHQEMERHFIFLYGYFINLYNGYRVLQNVSSILYLGLYKYKNAKSIIVKGNNHLVNMSMQDINTYGAVGEEYIEFLGLKIQKGLMITEEKIPAWVTLENMRGNIVEIKKGILVGCELVKSIVLRDITKIECDIRINSNEEVSIDIQNDLLRSDCTVSGGKCIFIVHTCKNFKIMSYCYNRIMYDGDENDVILKEIVRNKWRDICDGFYGVLNVTIKNKNWHLGYEDTYKMIADTIRGYDKLIDGRYNKNVNTLIEYVNKVAGDNIDKDAINDILVEYTAPKYNSRKRRK